MEGAGRDAAPRSRCSPAVLPEDRTKRASAALTLDAGCDTIDSVGGFEMSVPPHLLGWELVVDGHQYVLLEWPARAAREPVDLTPAERDVLAGILRGDSNATIARRRRTRPRTVANQVASLFRKLGVRSRSELVAHLMGGDAGA